MKNIECNLPDINFNIKVDEKNYEKVIKKINESIITFEKNTEKTITIEYIVDSKKFFEMLNLINDSIGIVYDSFKNQKHKEVKLNNEYYYLVDTQEYIGNKIDEKNYKIIVKENTETSANWIVRIIRELYLREKEDKGYFFMHGTALEIHNKGIMILGTSGSGKTTLAVKLLELNEIKGFLSNDRVFVNENLQMDYFPQAVTYAMGTVKNNNRLNQYFIDNKILERRKKLNYEEAENNIDCNTPLTDIAKVFDYTEMKARTKLDYIIYPRFDINTKELEVLEMSEVEEKKLLEITNFTPNDTESLRKPWIRKRKTSEKIILDCKSRLNEKIMKEVKIKKIKYGVNTKVEEILKMLEEE